MHGRFYTKAKDKVVAVIKKAVNPFHITLASTLCFLYSSFYVASSDSRIIEESAHGIDEFGIDELQRIPNGIETAMETLENEVGNTAEDSTVSYNLSSAELLAAGDPLIIRHFDYNENRITLEIPSMAYINYRFESHQRANLRVDRYAEYVTINDPYIIRLTEEVVHNLNNQNDIANAILDFVHHNFAYGYDPEPSQGNLQNYIKAPLETVVESNGDCEDLALLTATMMKIAGLDVVLFFFKNEELKLSHIAVGVSGDFEGLSYEFNGRNYFYAEASTTFNREYLPNNTTYPIGQMGSNSYNSFNDLEPIIIPLE